MNDSGLDLDRLNKARDGAEEKMPSAIRGAAKAPGKLGDEARSYVEGERISAGMSEMADQGLANTTKQAMAGVESEKAIAGASVTKSQAVPTLGGSAGGAKSQGGLGQPGAGGGLGKVPGGGAPLGSLGKPSRERPAGKGGGLDMA